MPIKITIELKFLTDDIWTQKMIFFCIQFYFIFEMFVDGMTFSSHYPVKTPPFFCVCLPPPPARRWCSIFFFLHSPWALFLSLTQESIHAGTQGVRLCRRPDLTHSAVQNNAASCRAAVFNPCFPPFPSSLPSAAVGCDVAQHPPPGSLCPATDGSSCIVVPTSSFTASAAAALTQIYNKRTENRTTSIHLCIKTTANRDNA